MPQQNEHAAQSHQSQAAFDVAPVTKGQTSGPLNLCEQALALRSELVAPQRVATLGASSSNANSARKTRAFREHHNLAPHTPLGGSNGRASILTGARLPLLKHPASSISPRLHKPFITARSALSKALLRHSSWDRRCQVRWGGYPARKSFQAPPTHNTYWMPFSRSCRYLRLSVPTSKGSMSFPSPVSTIPMLAHARVTISSKPCQECSLIRQVYEMTSVTSALAGGQSIFWPALKNTSSMAADLYSSRSEPGTIRTLPISRHEESYLSHDH